MKIIIERIRTEDDFYVFQVHQINKDNQLALVGNFKPKKLLNYIIDFIYKSW